MSLTALFLVLFAALVASQPEQVHTAITGIPNELSITWTNLDTSTLSEVPLVQWGPSNKETHGKSFKFDAGFYKSVVCTVLLQGLEAGTTYTYKVGTSGKMSKEYKFTYKPTNITYAVYGDMGFSNERSIKQLVAEVEAKSFDAVLHVGDFAYNLDTDSGRTGDKFMNSIEPVASVVPYMTCPGNHEAYHNFTHYINRFDNMNFLGSSSGSDNNLWYSWNEGLTHFIAIDTEVYAYSTDAGQIERQINWLTQDLIEANRVRDKYPWIVMFGHKGYWMDKVNWTDFERLSNEYGVDLYLCGHQHNYQRLYPSYGKQVQKMSSNIYVDPKYMVTIVSGSPGCPEYISKGGAPADTVANAFFTYGYGHMKIVNSTHLYWRWEMTSEAKMNLQNEVGSIHLDEADWKDDMWLIQTHHGKRQ